MRALFLSLIVTLFVAQAQQQIPTPESFFGFSVGERHLRPDQIVDYLRALDASSDRMTFEQYGETYEKRPLLLLTITSPENQKHIGEIKEQHRALSNPATSAGLDIESMPIVVWLGYSVHGNEASGSNAAVRVAYTLASAQGPEIEQMLARTVILLDPMINPDGLGRFSQWVNTHRPENPVADPASREHTEAWPGGRSNHYWFDLNRDWMPLQHPESRARLKKYYEWLPNILNDHHEMGTNSTFFFQPGAPGRTNPNTPAMIDELTRSIAKFHAEALDRIGSLYFSREQFDDFYIGKGSSYPDITGSLGILYEQASSRGQVQESVNGPLTFAASLRNHFSTSFSVLKAAQALRKELLSYQRTFFTSALKESEQSPIKGYVFSAASDPVRANSLLEILRRHQIEVYELAKQIQIGDRAFEPGNAYLVPTHQKQFRLLTSVFEKRTTFTDSLFYDVSSWTLPLAFNLPFAEVKTSARDLLGARIEWPEQPKGELAGAANAYAYAFEWRGYYAPRSLYRLLKAGIKTRVAIRPFESATSEGKRKFDYGTIMIPLGIQKEKADTLQRILGLIARDDATRVYALTTGLSVDGIDLGSPGFEAVPMPRIMLVVGTGVSSTDAGEVWHLLDHRFGMEVSLVETQALGRVDLNRYTTIAMSNGLYTSIDSAGTAAIRRWVESGGTLIAMEQAAEWAVNNRIATAKFRKLEPGKKDSVVVRRPYVEESRYSGALNLDGAIFEVTGDKTHPLLFGYDEDRISIFRGNAIFMDPSRNPYATPLVYTRTPLLSGYIHRELEPLVRNSAAIVISSLRAGRVILMTDNPNFRAFWYGTNKLFLNGIFFGPVIRQISVRSEE
jgi:hypothetical protein